MNELVENEDYYFDSGYLVFTSKYLEARGTCCGNGCRHCPYNFINVPEPVRSRLIQDPPLQYNNQDITKRNS